MTSSLLITLKKASVALELTPVDRVTKLREEHSDLRFDKLYQSGGLVLYHANGNPNSAAGARP